MAALTNTQISVTYVGLLKTSANTVLSSTGQQITDGEGNNSILFLSTAGVGIGGAASSGKELDVTGNVLVTGDLIVDNITIDGNTITSTSADFTIDASHDIILDAAGGNIDFKDNGLAVARFLNSTGSLVILVQGSDKDMLFKGNDGGSEITALTLDMSNGGDATFNGDITVSGGDITLGGTGRIQGIDTVSASTDAASKGYVDTQISGINTLAEILVGGNTTGGTDIAVSANDDITFTDTSKAMFGTGNDLQIFHNGSVTSFDNFTGNLQFVQAADDADIVFQNDDGSGGLVEYFRIDGGDTEVIVSKAFVFLDSVKAKFGGGNDLQIYHDGSNSYIDDAGTGDLYIRANNLRLANADGSEATINANNGGAVEIHHAGSKKFETTATGVSVTGGINVTDTSKIEKAQVTTQFDTSSFLRLHPSATTNSGGYTNMIFGTDTANNFGVAIGGKRAGTDGTPSFVVRMLNDDISGTEVLNILDTTTTTFTTSTFNIFKGSGAVKLEFGQTNGNWKIEAGNSGNNTLIIGSVSNATNNITLDTTNGGSATFSGDVTINRASNPTKLQIGSSLADDPFIVFQTDGNTMSMGIDRSDSNKFVISDNATLGTNNRFTIDTSGNATFAGELTANGDLIQVSGAHPELKLNDSDDSNYSLVSYSDGDLLISTNHGNEAGAADTIRFSNNGGTERMRIDSSGNVNIGTTGAASGSHKLVVESASTTGTVNSHIALIGDSATDGQGPQILFSESGDGQAFAGGTIGFTRTGGNSQGDLLFGTRGSSGDATTTTTERMRIDSNGVLQLTTTSASGFLNANSTALELDVNRNPETGAFGDTGKSHARIQMAGDNGGSTIKFNTANANNTTATERMRIDKNGNIGIGTTSPQQPFVVAEGTGQHGIELAPGTLSYIQAYDRAISDYGDLKIDAETIRFGTNNGAERMRIDSSGNVGIGTSTPDGKLEVAGGTTLGLRITNAGDSSAYDQTRITYSGYNSGSPEMVFMPLTTPGSGVLNTFFRFRNTNGSSTTANNVANLSVDGSVGIGTDSPNGKLHIQDGTTCSIDIENTTNTGIGEISFNDPDADDRGVLSYSHNLDAMLFKTAASERMRITSGGDILLGATSTGNTHAYFEAASNDRMVLALGTSTASASTIASFRNTNGGVGAISVSGTATSFLTSSDYRLKEDLQDFNGLEKVSEIKVYDFKWKTDENRSYGVMAHELEEVLPQAVNGKKDAEEMQKVDYSKIVPILVKSIQELKKEIEILKSK